MIHLKRLLIGSLCLLATMVAGVAMSRIGSFIEFYKDICIPIGVTFIILFVSYFIGLAFTESGG